MKKIAVIGILALFAVFAIPTASAQGYYYLVPADSNATYGNCIEVGLWTHPAIYQASGAFNLTYDPTCAEISCANWTGNTTQWPGGITCSQPALGSFYITYAAAAGVEYPPEGDYHIGNLTICCDSTTYCKVDFGYFAYETYHSNVSDVWWVPLQNATFTCGAPTEESFSKDLYDGWNLVSLPLTPSDNSTSSVLASVLDNVSAVYRYNATSKQFESASTMDSGRGYFVHVTQNCTWTYSGTPYTSMSTELKQGLNMVGWLNCSKPIDDALSSIDGDYWYVARWNAVSQSFEVFNPVAPSVFNDFTAMDRGTGYFISAKAGTTLSASC